MKYFLLFLLGGLISCSTPYVDNSSLPNTTMLVEKEVPQMTRSQVIMAVQECEASGMRPSMVMARKKVNGYLTDVPVDVVCLPKYTK